MHKLSDINWKELYDENFFSMGSCWTTCNSHCCKFNLYDGHKSKGVVLPLFPGEHQYFESIGGIINITDKAKKRTYHLHDDISFATHFLTCNCMGLCNPNEHRPLICRFYPYMPLVTVEGEIRGYDYIALSDLFYSNATAAHPCTLVRTEPDSVQKQLNESLPKLLKYPQFVFSFMVAELLANSLRKAMEGTVDDLSNEEKKSFYKKFELMVFTGKPWRSAEFKESVVDVYNQVEKQYGKFEL